MNASSNRSRRCAVFQSSSSSGTWTRRRAEPRSIRWCWVRTDAGMRVLRHVESGQGHLDTGCDLPGGHRRGGRIDRDQRGDGELAERVDVLDRAGEELAVGMDQLPPVPEDTDLPAEQPDPSRGQLALLVGHPEERQQELALAVGHDDLGARLVATRPGLAVLEDLGGDDLRHHRHVLVELEGGQVGELAAFGVAARVVAKQVPDGGHVRATSPAAWPPCLRPPDPAGCRALPSSLDSDQQAGNETDPRRRPPTSIARMLRSGREPVVASDQ